MKAIAATLAVVLLVGAPALAAAPKVGSKCSLQGATYSAGPVVRSCAVVLIGKKKALRWVNVPPTTTSPPTTAPSTTTTVPPATTVASTTTLPPVTTVAPLATVTTVPQLGTRANPAPAGQGIRWGNWGVRVNASQRDASAAVRAANRFNPGAAPGSKFVMVIVNVTYFGAGSESPYLDLSMQLLTDGGFVTEPTSKICCLSEASELTDLATGTATAYPIVFVVDDATAAGPLTLRVNQPAANPASIYFVVP